MNTPKPKLKISKPLFEVGDRVRIVGPSQHCGVVAEIKNSRYSGLSYGIKTNGLLLRDISPQALTKLC